MQVIAHNMISQFTDRQLNITSKEKGKAAEKLSTGYKINRSADDAAGLSISEKMRWQIRGLDKASDNVQDGVSLLQVADGALNEVHGILQRMRELAVQAANDSNTTEDRYAIQQEMNALGVEIDRIGEETEFNTQKIFKGGYTPMLDPNGNPIPISQIPVQNFQISRADLNYFPFTSSSSSNYLNLSVATTGGYTQSHWNLLYSSGNTSHSAVRVTYLDNSGNTVVKDCSLDDMQVGSSVISRMEAIGSAACHMILEMMCKLRFLRLSMLDSMMAQSKIMSLPMMSAITVQGRQESNLCLMQIQHIITMISVKNII